MATLFCVVCGRPSQRAAWNNTISTSLGQDTQFLTTYVACDFHSLSMIEASILNAQNINQPTADILNQDFSLQESPQV